METEQLKNLWAIYKVFCAEAARSTHLDSSSAPSFLGWLELRDEIGNSRFTQGVADGYAEGLKAYADKAKDI